MKMLTKGVQMAYELAFLLLFVLLILTPFHGGATRHLPLTQSINESRAVISGDLSGLAIGDTLPLYRFSYTWKVPIGEARIVSVSDGKSEIEMLPGSSWQLGRHGQIIQSGENYYASLGENFGIEQDQYLHIFRENVIVGQARVAEVEENRSRIDMPRDIGSPEGLTVSEFAVATQAVYFNNAFLSVFEIALIALALLGYIGVYASKRHSPFLLFGTYIRSLPLPKKAIFWVVNLAAGIPFSWFLGTMPIYLFAYIIAELTRIFLGAPISLRPGIDILVPFSILLVGLAYYGFLAWKQRSPVLAFWEKISYRGTGVVKSVSFQRGLINWALHSLVVYFFGFILFGFLKGNVAAVQSIGWPPPSLEAFFELAKYVLWTLTVVGCLIGYGYSVVSLLWGRYIRSIDFTVTGWLTNGFCYPLFGVVIWQMVPSFTGADPIVTAGPLLGLVFALGFFLNLLYTLSILNLWTMFDLMADKGVRTNLFYSAARHPNYALESAMFFTTELIGLSSGVHWLALSMFFFLYWIRSEREDNFMQYSNPDYAPYQKETPYKFIPGIY